MEALEHLQAVHTTLRLMGEHALCASGSDGSTRSTGLVSDRFVADFFIFLGQKSAHAEELKERCDMLMNRLPKVSIAFLQALVVENFTREASGSGRDAEKVPVKVCEPLSRKITSAASPTVARAFPRDDDKNSTIIFTTENIYKSKPYPRYSPPPGVSGDRFLAAHSVPLVGLRAMERASTTLEDFCRSYFMFHEIDVRNPQQLFKYLPVLSFVEAFIYQLDEENEEQVRAASSGTVALLPLTTNQDSRAISHCSVDRCAQDAPQSKTCSGEQDGGRDTSRVNSLGTEPFRGLEQALADQGLLTERITSELKDGLRYWGLEYALCEAVANGADIAAEDTFTAIKLKSFDYRVLNLLLYSLTGKEVNEAHFNFLAVSELLVEISDDLYDYEDDVLKNSFNVLRMLVKVYGPTKAPEILAKLISEQELRYQELLDGLEPSLAKHYQERCKEATCEGLELQSLVQQFTNFLKSGVFCASLTLLSKLLGYVWRWLKISIWYMDNASSYCGRGGLQNSNTLDVTPLKLRTCREINEFFKKEE